MSLCSTCSAKPSSGALRLKSWEAREPIEGADATKVNARARAAEFIAKPGRTEELRARICQEVIPLLRQQRGFLHTIVLTSYEEPRRVVVITFWSSEEDTYAPWEESRLVRKILSALVDVWPRSRTYNVDLGGTTETDELAMSQSAC
jgi:heme-degrading monooxygenase HmoA